MEQENIERTGFWGFPAKVLNEAGGAVVYAYDVGAGAVDKMVSTAKKAAVLPAALPRTIAALPKTVKGIFAGGLEVAKPSKSKIIEAKIKEREKKIKDLYYEIGKEGAKSSEVEALFELEPVKKLISDVREYEKEIQRLKSRVSELEEQEKEKEKEQEKEKALRKKKLEEKARLAKEKVRIRDVEVVKAVKSAIEKALRHGVFESTSERAIFDKIANDLLDSDMEIKVLAAAELGKMKTQAAVPVLIEAVKFDDPYLTSEVINALINIGDSRAIPLFKEKVTAPHYRVRVASLRGLYKLAGDEDVMPAVTDALRDEHPDVRRTGATFIGWKDYAHAGPGLVQCLRDEEERVRKAAISALASIRDKAAVLPLISLLGDKNLEMRKKALDAVKMIIGEEITFDVEASGKALSDAIDNLRAWWQEKRLGVEVAERGEAVKPEAEEAAARVEAADERQAEIERVWAEEEPAPSEEPEPTEEQLKRMLKAELISMCKDRGVECDESLTKVEIIELILGKKQ
ncbi:MAG: HEAT repeat domain-containing protein [Deltaproteobacteria bacterium]|nr:HEAT repeat domain-containing protein [Deltaproteobacteria bacterium]